MGKFGGTKGGAQHEVEPGEMDLAVRRPIEDPRADPQGGFVRERTVADEDVPLSCHFCAPRSDSNSVENSAALCLREKRSRTICRPFRPRRTASSRSP